MTPPRADPGALAARWLPELQDYPLLVVDVPGIAEAEQLVGRAADQVRWWCTHWPTHRALAERGYASTFAPWPPQDPPAAALVFLPKSRDRLRMVLAALGGTLPPGAPLWVVGARRAGIESAAVDLATVAEPMRVEVGKHSRLHMSEARACPPATLDQFAETWMLELGPERLGVCSFPGVFSHGRLDDGTRLLLNALPDVAGATLDVGCGAGVVGAWYARRNGVAVTLVDADALAIEASRRTLALNDLPGAVEAADVLPSGGGAFADIVSNPPFHRGVDTDHRVTAALVSGAASRLVPGGNLTLVCNVFLPVTQLLDRTFGAHRVLAEDSRFRVYQARR